jgi:hypothetical protein
MNSSSSSNKLSCTSSICSSLANALFAIKLLLSFRVSFIYRYKCYYCQFDTSIHQTIVNHCCQHHRDETLKFRSFEFNTNLGTFGYQSKDLRIKPIEVLNGNDRLFIDNDEYKIRILANEEQSHLIMFDYFFHA